MSTSTTTASESLPFSTILGGPRAAAVIHSAPPDLRQASFSRLITRTK
jgi:hypothetical protein